MIPVSVEYLDRCNRKDMASILAIKLAVQQPQRSKQFLPDTGIVEYFQDASVPEIRRL